MGFQCAPICLVCVDLIQTPTFLRWAFMAGGSVFCPLSFVYSLGVFSSLFTSFYWGAILVVINVNSQELLCTLWDNFAPWLPPSFLTDAFSLSPWRYSPWFISHFLLPQLFLIHPSISSQKPVYFSRGCLGGRPGGQGVGRTFADWWRRGVGRTLLHIFIGECEIYFYVL